LFHRTEAGADLQKQVLRYHCTTVSHLVLIIPSHRFAY
jgi:hypothetical protein